MTKYLYGRVSTKQQTKGNSLEDQAEALKRAHFDGELVLEQYSGAHTDRPKFQEVIDKMRPGDYLVVTKLDRLARNLKEGLEVIEELMERGCKIHILNMGLLEDTPTGKLLYSVLLAFAEFERAMIIERTSAGKEVAKQKPGFKEGRPRKYSDKLYKTVEILRNEGKSYQEIADTLNMSKSAVARYFKQKEAEALLDE